MPQAVIRDGIEIMEEMLCKWGSHVNEQDIIMSDAEHSPEVELENLHKYLQVYQSRIEGNSWLQSIVTSL